MELEGFKFYYSGGWGEWPYEYLYSVLSHRLSLQVLRSQQKDGSDKQSRLAKMPEIPEHLKKQNMEREKKYQEFLARKTAEHVGKG
jgi:(p)ppGpp synthase/HD superfamily hydrolase